MTLTLYTDPICYQEYDLSDDTIDSTLNVDSILQQAGYLSSEQMRQFNDAMTTFHRCQPCRAYNLDNTNGQLYYDGNDNNNNNNYYSDNDPHYPKYSCYDVAGYTNVNQCMKFRTKTQMMPMTQKDIHVATLQGTITHVQFYQKSDSDANRTTHHAQSLHTLSSSYQSIYFQPSLNEERNVTNISSAVAYAILSVAMLWTIGTISYCFSVCRWVIKKNTKQNIPM
jgi:hypothetical protein